MSWLHCALAMFAMLLGAFVALQHPLWSAFLLPVFLLWSLAVFWRPLIWLAVLPALLPVAGFSPWTGWIGVEEFDLLALGAVVGSQIRLAVDAGRQAARGRLRGGARLLQPATVCAESKGCEAIAGGGQAHVKLASATHETLFSRAVRRVEGRDGEFTEQAPWPISDAGTPAGMRPTSAENGHDLPAWTASRKVMTVSWAQMGVGLLGISYLCSLLHGLADAGGLPLGWFQGYEEPLNSLRAAKSFGLVLLLLPSLLGLLRSDPVLAGRRLLAGVLTGLALVALAVLWERGGYPGLFDFSTPYRTTAMFWEMHVGGAAIDGFLVLALPFVAQALAHTSSPRRWALAAALALVAVYACLTTFSRALYLGVLASLSVFACAHFALGRQRARLNGAAVVVRDESWRGFANRVLTVMLVVEVVTVFGSGNFMGTRLAAGERDLGGRLQHWREGLSLLRTPSEWLLGRGLGRFPANYSQTVPGRSMPGRLQLVGAGQARCLRLFRPPHDGRARGAFALLQRLPPLAEGAYTVAMDLRAPPSAKLRVALCHTHLLYAASCLQTMLVVPSRDDGWSHFSLPLVVGKEFSNSWPAFALGFLTLRPEGQADFLDVDNLSIVDAKGQLLLANGDFSAGLAHWFFAGYHYFVPWHVDSLFLEMLIDQGAIGLLLLLGVLAMALVNLLQGPGRVHVLAPCLLAALVGCLTLGLFVSVLDMPRTAFLFYLLLCSALFLDGRSAADLAKPPPVFPQAPSKCLRDV